MHFNEMDIPDREYFNEKVDASSDWEVSFYRSLSKVDGLLVLGGGPSTLIAGQIALSPTYRSSQSHSSVALP